MSCGQAHENVATVVGATIPQDMALKAAPRPTIGPYTITAQLGSGGMGEVYRVQSPTGQTRALKVIHPHLVDGEFMARFKREANLLLKLDHPHIVKASDYNEGPPCYLAMEFIEGQSLDKKLTGKPLPSAQTTRLISDIASALDYAHEQGAIHRDIKPGNIMLNQDGRAMLTDFGLVRLRETSLQLTMKDTVMGTPGYMSPEQAAGLEVDHRSDVYSLGVVAYEMLTGRIPFKGDTPVAQLMSRLYDSPIPPRQARSDLPPAVERVLLRALARQPEERYQTAGEFAADLRRAWQAPVEKDKAVTYSLPAQPAGDGAYLVEARDLLGLGSEGQLNLGGVIVPAARWREAANIFYQLGGQARLSIFPPGDAGRGSVAIVQQGGLNLRMDFTGEPEQAALAVNLVEREA